MSKSRKMRRCNNFKLDNYWQTSDYNSALFMMYRQQIIKLAMNRFKWINLPPTCNERYLEMTLLFQGIATIAFPSRQRGTFYSTQVAQMSPPNVYDNPTKWLSVGNNGWRFKCSNRNGVIVWDNRARYPLMQMVDIWARELVDVRRTKQLNRMHVKTPYLIKCSPEQEQQAENIYKQMAGGEPAIITTTGIENIDIDVIKTDVPYLGEELTAEEINTWQQIYQMLGIENLTFKAERMVQDEVNKRDEPSDLMALDGLNCRREACEQLNNRFGDYLEAPITCVWAKDNISQNFNFMANIKEQLELDEGEVSNYDEER